MGQAIPDVTVEGEDIVEIVVHITEALEEQQRLKFISALEYEDHIFAVNFSPDQYHLLLVKYYRNRYSSQDVLASLESQKVNARLVGPI